MPKRLIRIVRCCRDWPVDALNPIGKCGLCGQIPESTTEPVYEDETDYQTGVDS